MRSIVCSAIAALLLACPGARAQVERVVVKIDGLSCAFCAYGLEKKLHKVEGVGTLEIKVDEGLALIAAKKGQALSVVALERAVKDGGFTPGPVSLTVRGRLVDRAGATILSVTEGEMALRVEDGEKLQALWQALDAEQEVRLTGSVARADAAADESELLVFSLQDFELLRSGADTKPAK